MPNDPKPESLQTKNTVSVTAPERLFSLVLALVATESGLTKTDILASVQGYRQRYSSRGANESLERQFERDKDDLRELGIPLETIDSPHEPGGNHFLRYRIPKGRYDLPTDVIFSAGEVALLKLAGTVWREGSLSGESRRALMKLNSLGVEASEPALSFSPLLRTRDRSFEPLSKALGRDHVVAFLYLKPGKTTPSRRVVAPRALVQHQGRWHLYAVDEIAQAPRTFLLSRIVGNIVVQPKMVPSTLSSISPDGVQDHLTDSARALNELERLWDHNTASVVVVAGSDAAVRLGARLPGHEGKDADNAFATTTRLLNFTDLNIFADELAAFGPEVYIVSPPELALAVQHRLTAARDAHSEATVESPITPTPLDRVGSARIPAPVTAGPRVAGDQLTLLLSLVPYLLDHDGVSVGEVATRFGLSHERVRALVKLIALSGIPGETRQYLHGDLFDIHWDEFESNDRIVLTHQVAIDDSPRFSAREAAALIAGLQYLSALPHNADTDAIASLMAKLTRGASAPPTQVAVAHNTSDSTRNTVHAALTSGMLVEFDYLNARGQHEHRLVDPLRIESVDSDWYLRGWCYLREAVRTFRLDRMSDPRVAVEQRQDRPTPAVLPSTLFQASTSDISVVLELPTDALELLADYRPEQTELVGSGLRTRTTVRMAHTHVLKRLITGLAGIVTVLYPPTARRVVFDWAEAGLAQYDKPAERPDGAV